jgi:hypothetical protein
MLYTTQTHTKTKGVPDPYRKRKRERERGEREDGSQLEKHINMVGDSGGVD